MPAARYRKPDRLGDVLALIQVLALHKYGRRSEKGAMKELQVPPKSAASWTEVASEHPEFFRVESDDELPISLVARHALETGELEVDFVGKLLEAAMELHDRELSRSAHWRAAWPTLLAVAVGAFLTVLGSLSISYVQQKDRVDEETLQAARNVYSRLSGRRFATIQLYVSRHEARVFADYHQARLQILGQQKDQLGSQETQRWMRRSEDLVSEILKNNQALFEDLAIARTVYPDSQELRDAFQRLSDLRQIALVDPPRGDLAALERWKLQAVHDIQAIAERDYGKRFDTLLAILLKELPSRPLAL